MKSIGTLNPKLREALGVSGWKLRGAKLSDLSHWTLRVGPQGQGFSVPLSRVLQ